MGKFNDLTGQRFGKLTVVELAGHNDKGIIIWKCLCDCGKTTIVTVANLGRSTNSCGCMSSRLTAKEDSTTHGMSKTKLYWVWNSMVNRCTNPNQKSYSRYGAKGIKVCERWLKFIPFYEDMGYSYKEGLSIERKDNNLGYCLENCIWIPKEKQAINKSNTRKVMYNGEYTSLRNYCKIYNKSYHRTIDRINRGMSLEEAINKPKRGDIL